MDLICKANDKFPETIALIEDAKTYNISVYDKPQGNKYFIYGTRPFVLPYVNDPMNCLNNTEYIYDYSYMCTVIPEEMRFNKDVHFNTLENIRKILSWARPGKNGVFIRPNSGNKEFTGRAFSNEELANHPPQELTSNYPWLVCAFCDVKDSPDEEYRVFVHNGGAIYTTYWPNEEEGVKCPVDEFAQKVIRKIRRNDPNAYTYVLDIARDKNGYSVLELNSWNSSSFYSIDPHTILRTLFK